MANAIFISYRRDDSEGESGRLFDDLVRAFGPQNVFMDVAGIQPGADFRKAIEDNVASCGVLLAIVGPTWATIANASGQRRLDDPNDFVSLEIGSALKRGVPVIPVLVHDARMPAPDVLPESLADFSYRNSVELSHARWNSDVQLLIHALTAYVKPNAATAADPVHATVPVQLPAPHPTPIPAVKSKLPIILGVSAVILLALAAVFYFLSRSPTTSSLIGSWQDPSPRTAGANSLVALTISGSGNSLSVHPLANCTAGTCDWGTQPAQFDGTNATATFAPSELTAAGETRQAVLTLHHVSGGLDVFVNNTFTGPNGSRTNHVHRVFVPGS